MRVLVITNQVPYPAMSGAPLRTYSILRRLAKTHDVYLAAFISTEEQKEGVAHLLEFCRAVVTVRANSLKQMINLGRVLASVWHGTPPELKLAFSHELAKEIRTLVDRVDFDIVQIEHGSMGMYLEALPQQLRKRAVWVLHDIDFHKFRQMAHILERRDSKARASLHAMMMRWWQPSFASYFGLCVTMSEADRRLLLSANRSLTVVVSPNGVDTHHHQPLPDEGDTADVLFMGNMAYEPNVDAALHFCHNVLPLVRKEVVDTKLWIVGINPEASVRRLEGNGVFVTGGVPDVVPYYKRAKVCVAPLRAGSGTRLKILEAMALGRPVVSTSIGCEGLDVIDGKHILVADDSKGFAEKTTQLLRNYELRARIAAKARDFVVASYDWDVIADNLMNELDRMAKAGATYASQ